MCASLLLLLASAAGAAEDDTMTCTGAPHGAATLLGSRPQILLFGDSITQHAAGRYGWATELAEVYSRKADVINRGFSGYNSAVAWSMLKQSTALGVHGRGDNTLMVIFFGANDATAPDYYMHVPVDEYGENLRSIVRRSQESMPGITIVVVTPPPIDEERLLEFDWYAGRSTELAGAYAEEAASAAKDVGAGLLDIHNLMIRKPEWKAFLSDGLHLSPVGQAFLADELLKMLRNGPWNPKNMPDHYPAHIDIFEAMNHAGQRDAKICPWPGPDGKYCFQRVST